MDFFNAKIVCPSGIVFEGNAWQVKACNSNGTFAVRAGHAAMFTSLVSGTLEVALKPDERKKFVIPGGIFEFFEKTCSVMCEKAEPATVIKARQDPYP
jgi:F0F1-type ATP synthase epsilon subunit